MNEELKQFERLFNSGNMGHAYLLYGKNNEEIHEFALGLSAIILKEKDLKSLKKNLEFHLVEREDEEEIKIEKIRKLIGFLALSAPNGGFKVALIKDAGRMNKNAANAILKVLEEPSKKKVLILTSSDHGNLLPTILSRVQKIQVLTKQDNNVMNNSKLIGQLEKLLESETAGKFEIMEKISKGENVISLLDVWLSFFHDIIYVQSNCIDLVKNRSCIDLLEKVSKKYSEEETKNIIEEILKTKDILRNTNANMRLALENLALNF